MQVRFPEWNDIFLVFVEFAHIDDAINKVGGFWCGRRELFNRRPNKLNVNPSTLDRSLQPFNGKFKGKLVGFRYNGSLKNVRSEGGIMWVYGMLFERRIYSRINSRSFLNSEFSNIYVLD